MREAGAPGVGDATPREGSELARRIASAAVMVAVALAATWAGGPAFAAFWLAAAIAIAWEWIAMTRAVPRRLLSLAASAGLAAMTVLAARRMGAGPVGGVAVATVLMLLVIGRGASSRGWSCAGFLYAGLVAVVPVVVRESAGLGALAILWIFAVVWTTDIAAFFVGRGVGGPKLWPAVSPKKTWSGFLGGLVGATVAGAGVHALASSWDVQAPLGILPTVMFSALGSVACQFGDLGESALKRRCAVKDSSRLIPGHGGVMDRLDGFVAVLLIVGLALAGARPLHA